MIKIRSKGFFSDFDDLLKYARKKGWSFNGKPVTIAWLLGYDAAISKGNMNNFAAGSLAWSDYEAGFNASHLDFPFLSIGRERTTASDYPHV